ncbi:MAG: COX aromatic rich motif-containing protein [Candidatus Saccharimonadales bacterium]
MKRFLSASIIPVGLGIFIVAMWFAMRHVTIDVLAPTGKIATEQLKLLYFTLALSVIVVVPVFTMLGIFAYKYREGRDADYKPEYAHNNKLEAVWWGIPIAIIAVLSVVTWQTSNSLDPYKPIVSDKPTIEVQVVALQWKWLFIYPDYEIATVNELPIPVEQPVHFTLAADAPMSAFWIPSLGSQIYSMNGMSSELNLLAHKTGNYMGYNTNINGQGYSQMKFTTKVMPQADFDTWRLTAGIKAMIAGDHLDEATYNVLAKPSVLSEPQTYHLMKRDLYDTIVAKYMGHGMSHGSSHSATTEDTPLVEKNHTHHGGQH